MIRSAEPIPDRDTTSRPGSPGTASAGLRTILKQPWLLTHEPTTWHGIQQMDTSGGWSIDIYRSILKFRGVSTLDEYLQRVDELLVPPEVERAPAIPSPLDPMPLSFSLS